MHYYQYSGVLHEYIMMNDSRKILADQKIKSFLLYNKKILKDSTCCKILDVMYPDVTLSIKQITSYIDKPYTYAKKIILQMYSDGYLHNNNNNEKKYNRKYCLSPTGRWFAVCVQLDYIPFQSLLILSQTYCRAKKNPKCRTNFYMISKFRDSFDKSCDQDMSCASAIYSNSNISKSIKQLTDRNLVYWANSDFLKINFTVFEFLQKYDDELNSLVEWCNKTFEKCKDEYLEGLEIGREKKHLFELTIHPSLKGPL
jgi:hypothetical protein